MRKNERREKAVRFFSSSHCLPANNQISKRAADFPAANKNPIYFLPESLSRNSGNQFGTITSSKSFLFVASARMRPSFATS